MRPPQAALPRWTYLTSSNRYLITKPTVRYFDFGRLRTTLKIVRSPVVATASHPSDPAVLSSFSTPLAGADNASKADHFILPLRRHHVLPTATGRPIDARDRGLRGSIPRCSTSPAENRPARGIAHAGEAPPTRLRQGQFRLVDDTGVQPLRHLTPMVPTWNRILRPCPGLRQPAFVPHGSRRGLLSFALRAGSLPLA